MTKPLPRVKHHTYGKSLVRLSRIHRHADRHDFTELTVWIELEGDFDSAYTSADNSLVIAPDTMKNTVYVLASRYGVESIERFARILGEHFVEKYSQVDSALIRIEEVPWTRMEIAGQPHPHAFVGGASERHTCNLAANRNELWLTSGLTDLRVLKTTESGFAGFYRDSYTTLADTADQILSTAIATEYPCGALDADWTAHRQTIRAAMLDVFANRYSPSVQNTLYDMARAALDACSAIDEIEITMPNQPHLLANLTPFGISNPNEVFIPTDEPHGNLTATVARSNA